MKPYDRILYLWGNGGYCVLRQQANGRLTVPEGRRAWESFVRFAPSRLLLAALQTLKEGTSTR